MPAPNPNTETRTAMQDVAQGDNLSGPFSVMDDLLAALETEGTNK